MQERLFYIFHWPAVEQIEWFSVRAALWWIVLLTSGFDLFASNPLFGGLARIGPEWKWQAVMSFVTGIGLLAFLRGKDWHRAVALLLAAVMWGFIAGYVSAEAPRGPFGIPKNTGLGVYAGLACDCIWGMAHLVRRAVWDWLKEKEKAQMYARKA